jgi:hypothetical protein
MNKDNRARETSTKLAPVEQLPIEDDAAREALEGALHYRKQFAALLHTAEFQQMPLEQQIRIEHVAAKFEHALEDLAFAYRRAQEMRRRVGGRLRAASVRSTSDLKRA